MSIPIKLTTATAADPVSGFKFGPSSRKQLATGNPMLQMVVQRALELSPYDFGIAKGFRTKKEQAAEVAAGNSRTMDSRHTDAPKSNAFDIFILDENGKVVPMTNHKQMKKYGIAVADAMRQAARELGVDLTWGGSWGNIRNSDNNLFDDYMKYVKDKRAAGKEPLFDSGHYEFSKVDKPPLWVGL